MTRPIPPTLFDPAGLIVGRKDLATDQYAYKLAGSHFAVDTIFSDALEFNESRMSIWIPFVSGRRRDGVGDLTEVGGIRTERHRMNPISQFDHGKNVSIPIGYTEDPETREYAVVLDPASQTGKGNVFFYQGRGLAKVDPSKERDHALFCEQLYDLLVKRFVRAGSFTYQIVKALPLNADQQSGTPQGLHLLVTNLLELGPVILPANQDTVVKGLAPDPREILCLNGVCGKPLSPVLRKSLEPYASEKRATMMTGSKAKQAANIVVKKNGNYYVASYKGAAQWGEGTGSTEQEAIDDLESKFHQGVAERETYEREQLNKELSPLTRTDVPPARWRPGKGAECKSASFSDWKDAHNEAEKMANQTGLDVAIRKANQYGKTVFNVSFASRNDSDYARAEIVQPMNKKSQIPGDLNWMREEAAESEHKSIKVLRKMYGRKSSDGFKAKIVQYGRRLDGKQGVTGEIQGVFSAEEIRSQHDNAAKRGGYVQVLSLDGRQSEVDSFGKSWLQTSTKGLEVLFNWSDNPVSQSDDRPNRKIRVRDGGGERTITFAELEGMVGQTEARRLVQLAIRRGSGRWRDQSERYDPKLGNVYMREDLKALRKMYGKKGAYLSEPGEPCSVCGQEMTVFHDHPHDYVGTIQDFQSKKPCLACHKVHGIQQGKSFRRKSVSPEEVAGVFRAIDFGQNKPGGTVQGAKVREIKDQLRGKVPQDQRQFMELMRQLGFQSDFHPREDAWIIYRKSMGFPAGSGSGPFTIEREPDGEWFVGDSDGDWVAGPFNSEQGAKAAKAKLEQVDSKAKALTITCDYCGVPFADGESRHETSAGAYHDDCWLRRNETDRVGIAVASKSLDKEKWVASYIDTADGYHREQTFDTKAEAESFLKGKKRPAGVRKESEPVYEYQRGHKSLDALRKLYRPTKGLARRLRKSAPGTSIVHVAGKDMEEFRKAAEGKGCKVQDLGRRKTHQKFKVTGDDDAIGSLAKEWGRRHKMLDLKASFEEQAKALEALTGKLAQLQKVK